MALMMTGLAKSGVRLELGSSAAGTATVLDTVVEVGPRPGCDNVPETTR